MNTPVCPSCGSSNLHFDATAVWDPNLQHTVLLTSYDDFECGDCGAKGKAPNWRNPMKAVLTITVEYDVSEAKDLPDPRQKIEDLLIAAAEHLYDVGLLSGETELSGEEWNADVTVTS